MAESLDSFFARCREIVNLGDAAPRFEIIGMGDCLPGAILARRGHLYLCGAAEYNDEDHCCGYSNLVLVYIR